MTTGLMQPILDPSLRMRPSRSPRNRNRVCKQLFGQIDHEETRKFLKAEFEKEHLQASEAWGFDFVKGIPKDSGGRYKWTKMPLVFAPRRPKKPEPEPDITDLYASPLPCRFQAESEEDKSDQKKEENGEQSDDKKLKQTKIPDFMAIRKRSRESISKSMPVIPSKISKYNDVTS